MGEDTEVDAVPDLKQEFPEVKIVNPHSSHCPIIKLATFFCLIRVDFIHRVQFVLKPMRIKLVVGK